MEALTEHALEPEMAEPPPRATRLPPRLTLLLGAATLMLGLFILGGARALWEAGELTWLGYAGQTATAHVTTIGWETARKGETPHQAAIRYAVDLPNGNGPPLHRTGWIGLARPRGPGNSSVPTYALGQALPVRYAPWFGGVAGQVWRPSPRGRIGSLAGSGGLVLLVSLTLLDRLWRRVGEQRRLLRHGVATVGTITHKHSEGADTGRYVLRYGYAPAREAEWEAEWEKGAGREGEQQVSLEQWRRFEVGQPVTVLFDPDRPDRSALYALMRMV